MNFELPPENQDKPYDFVEWDLGRLRYHARLLKGEVEMNNNPRQAARADRELGHVAFELWARAHHDVRTPEPTAA